jgi:hypothetical protein
MNAEAVGTAAEHSVTLCTMTDGAVVGHIAGCIDVRKASGTARIGVESRYTLRVFTKRDAFLDYNEDLLPEVESEGDLWKIRWLPCADSVPEG